MGGPEPSDLLQTRIDEIVQEIEAELQQGGIPLTAVKTVHQILIVERMSVRSANHVLNENSEPTVYTKIQLDGYGDRHSSDTLRRGYIHFYPNRPPRRPSFNSRAETDIHFDLAIGQLSAVQEQLKMQRHIMIYLKYDSGHIYGELYSL